VNSQCVTAYRHNYILLEKKLLHLLSDVGHLNEICRICYCLQILVYSCKFEILTEKRTAVAKSQTFLLEHPVLLSVHSGPITNASRYRVATHGAVLYRAVQCHARKQTRIHTMYVSFFFHKSGQMPYVHHVVAGKSRLICSLWLTGVLWYVGWSQASNLRCHGLINSSASWAVPDVSQFFTCTWKGLLLLLKHLLIQRTFKTKTPQN